MKTAKFKASYDCRGECPEETIMVEVTRDGDLLFLDRDMEYETAFAAMGGHSAASEMLERWRQYPMEIVVQNLGIHSDILALIVLDCAEHVLPIYEEAHPKDERLGKALKVSRGYLLDNKLRLKTIGIDVDRELMNYIYMTRDIIEGVKQYFTTGQAESVQRVAECVKDAIDFARTLSNSRASASIALGKARIARADVAAPFIMDQTESSIWKSAMAQEQAWQVRRVVDVMHALTGDSHRMPRREALDRRAVWESVGETK